MKPGPGESKTILAESFWVSGKGEVVSWPETIKEEHWEVLSAELA